MNQKIKSIQNFLTKNEYDFYLVTNSDIHLNESPNLFQKDIYNLTGFDCSNGYLLIFDKKTIFFTDSRYTLAAEKFFKKKIGVINLKERSISNYLMILDKHLKGLVDPKLISINEINNLSKELNKSNIKIIPFTKNLYKKNYFPDFETSYPFSLPKYCIPRAYEDNIKWIRSRLNSDGILIWNNAHIAYLLNIRSFEIHNSTKPFAGLFISKKLSKPIIISNNKFLLNIEKIKNNFQIMTQSKFISNIFSKKLILLELQYNYSNFDIYRSLSKNIKIINTKIDIDKKISQKTTKEIKNIKICHKEDGLSLTRFILQLNKNKSFTNEYSIASDLYQLRKEGINFFCNSFDYISALDQNAAIVHYKPTKIKSEKLSDQSILLIDSGAHYLEGTTDVTRVLKLNTLKFKEIKKYYTYLLKSLIMIENTSFINGITGSDLDNFLRNYLLKFNISYGHGTGHAVGYFNDVHEKYPLLGPNSKHKILNNNLFSIEPGFYLKNKFGLRIENLYFSKVHHNKIQLINTTLVPYDISLIDWNLILPREKKFIKSYHKRIFDEFRYRFSDDERKKYKKTLIDKI